MDVSHRQEVSTSSSCCCRCEPEFDPAELKSRHDALDSPSTLGIRVPSPLAWGRNGVRELRAQRRHVLGDGGKGGSVLTASPFLCTSTIGVPVEFSTATAEFISCDVWSRVGVVSASYEQNVKCIFLP